MTKSSREALIVALAFASVSHTVSAKAEAIIGNGYACYPSSYVYDCAGCTKSAYNKWNVDITLQECFNACNATRGCKAVEWLKASNSNVHWCYLYTKYQSVESETVLPEGKEEFACVKLPNKVTPYGPPPNETWIPNPPTTPFQDSLRPGPQPGPSPRR